MAQGYSNPTLADQRDFLQTSLLEAVRSGTYSREDGRAMMSYSGGIPSIDFEVQAALALLLRMGQDDTATIDAQDKVMDCLGAAYRAQPHVRQLKVRCPRIKTDGDRTGYRCKIPSTSHGQYLGSQTASLEHQDPWQQRNLYPRLRSFY